MAYTKYSLTPSSNTAAPPDGAPEGMLPSAVNDTMRDMMAQIRDCGDGIRDGTYTMTAPKITGGTITGSTINNSAIGGTTATTGKFTTLEATGVATFSAGTVSAPAITTTGDTNTGIFFPAADTIAFTEGGVESMRIDSSGNLGIGTSSPATKLHVSGQTRIADSSDSANRITIGVGANAPYGNASISTTTAGLAIVAEGAGNMTFSNNGSERMRITSGGNLEMASNAGFLQLPTNQTMRIPSDGGIGYVGHINSSSVFQIAYNSTSSGVQLSSGATSWGTFSDSRLKNITGTYTNALNDIAQIQPVKFTWKSDEDNKPQVGVVAQSVENVVPEAVDSTTIEMDGTEKYLTVRYTELIPLMIASIQELKAELDSVKAELQTLKGN
jgi:hypothetical protein